LSAGMNYFSLKHTTHPPISSGKQYLENKNKNDEK